MNKYLFESIIIVIVAAMYKDSSSLWLKEWLEPDSFYGLGLFVLGFDAYYIKTNFLALKETPKSSSIYGIFLVLVAALLYIVGIRASLDYLVNFSFPAIISGIVLSIYGYKTLQKLFIPIILLALILPIFPLHRITMPLQLISTKLSSGLLNILGLNSYSEGIILYVNHIRMAVIAGCSGLKSIFSLFFVAIISCYIENIKAPKQIIYLTLILPFAVVMNVLRITVTAFYGLYNGYKGLETFHDYAGIVVNIISILLIIFVIKTNTKKEELL